MLDISQCTISAFQKYNSLFKDQIVNPISTSTIDENTTSKTSDEKIASKTQDEKIMLSTVDEKKKALEYFTFTFLKYFPYLWTLQLNNHLRANEGALVSSVVQLYHTFF